MKPLLSATLLLLPAGLMLTGVTKLDGSSTRAHQRTGQSDPSDRIPRYLARASDNEAPKVREAQFGPTPKCKDTSRRRADVYVPLPLEFGNVQGHVSDEGRYLILRAGSHPYDQLGVYDTRCGVYRHRKVTYLDDGPPSIRGLIAAGAGRLVINGQKKLHIYDLETLTLRSQIDLPIDPRTNSTRKANHLEMGQRNSRLVFVGVRTDGTGMLPIRYLVDLETGEYSVPMADGSGVLRYNLWGSPLSVDADMKQLFWDGYRVPKNGHWALENMAGPVFKHSYKFNQRGDLVGSTGRVYNPNGFERFWTALPTWRAVGSPDVVVQQPDRSLWRVSGDTGEWMYPLPFPDHSLGHTKTHPWVKAWLYAAGYQRLLLVYTEYLVDLEVRPRTPR